MPISARNQLEGKVVEVTLGDIMAHVVEDRQEPGRKRNYSAQRQRAQAEEGDKVKVVIKSTEVMLDKD